MRTVVVTADGKYNAFPALARRADGSLMAVYRKGTAHISAGSSLSAKTSSDEGKAWSPEFVVYANGADDVRDPSLTQLSTGVLILSFFKYDAQSGRPLNSYTIRSSDGGKTWDAPVPIAVPSAAANSFYVAVSAPVVELTNGYLIVPTYGQYTAPIVNKVYQSMDGGNTWAELGNIASNTGHVEPTIVRLENGNLIATLRNQATSMISVSFSTTNGATWTNPVDVFPGISRANIIADGSSVTAAYRTINSAPAMRNSIDGGWAWEDIETTFVKASRPGYEYASFLKLNRGTGMVWCAQADNGKDSDCFFSTF